MRASGERDRLYGRSTGVPRRAVFPAIDGRRFFDAASAQMKNSKMGTNWLSAHHWLVEVFGEGRTQVAVVTGGTNGYSPFAHGRELMLTLLASAGKPVSARAGEFEVDFELNAGDLGLSFDETAAILLGPGFARRAQNCLVIAEGEITIGEKSGARISVIGEHDGQADASGELGVRLRTGSLWANVYASSPNGLLGAMKSLICRLRPIYGMVGGLKPEPWDWRVLARFVVDFHGRFGWCNKTPAERFERGFSLALPRERPFWLGAPPLDGDPGKRLASSTFELEYRGELLPTTGEDGVLKRLIDERRFFVRRFPGGLFFEWVS